MPGADAIDRRDIPNAFAQTGEAALRAGQVAQVQIEQPFCSVTNVAAEVVELGTGQFQILAADLDDAVLVIQVAVQLDRAGGSAQCTNLPAGAVVQLAADQLQIRRRLDQSALIENLSDRFEPQAIAADLAACVIQVGALENDLILAEELAGMVGQTCHRQLQIAQQTGDQTGLAIDRAVFEVGAGDVQGVGLQRATLVLQVTGAQREFCVAAIGKDRTLLVQQCAASIYGFTQPLLPTNGIGEIVRLRQGCRMFRRSTKENRSPHQRTFRKTKRPTDPAHFTSVLNSQFRRHILRRQHPTIG